MRPYMQLSKVCGTANSPVGRRTAVRTAIVRISLLFCCQLAFGICADRASADVTSVDDVWLEEMPGVFTQDNLLSLQNEGVPTAGNSIDPFQGIEQTGFEGRLDDMGTPDPMDDANINFNIIVGRVATGQLILSGPFSVLRDQDLIIGDIGIPPTGEDVMVRGHGTVRIEGNGALFNNDPTILPFLVWPPPPDPDAMVLTESPSVNDRAVDVGFDVYLGRAGTGIMRLALGGRAEIQDALIVGDLSGSNGRLELDGFDTSLQSGGFEPETMDPDEIHQMVIGRQGIGVMDILNGARVTANTSEDAVGSGNLIGAVIGSDPFIVDDDAQPAGKGHVNLAGNGSLWTIRGSLQVGGFNGEDGLPSEIDDIEGETLEYGVNVGEGRLDIGAGASVTILPVDAEVLVFPLELVIGRHGIVNLTGGQLIVGSNLGDEEAGEFNDSVRIFNDGTISGDGQIDTGIFRNRYLGLVEVLAGQRMVVSAKAIFEDADDEAPPMINWGVIRVIGSPDLQAELEFDRSPTTEGLPAPFENRQLTAVPLAGRAAGQIIVQDGTLRFGTGLANQGAVAFTGGDNRVVGDVLNLPGDGMLVSDGVISIDGIGTEVIFEDNFDNDGLLDVGLGSNINVLGDYVQDGPGTLSLVIDQFGAFPMTVMGDVFLDAAETPMTSNLQLSYIGASPQPGDVFGLLSVIGELAGMFHLQSLPSLGPDLGLVIDYNYSTDTVTARVLSLVGLVGADFNGDGVVNEEDLAIWEMNFGITDGATALQGDADGDGDVDGDDYEEWLMQMMPGAGAGSGGLAAVPEPSSFVLLMTSGLLAIVLRRRKH